MKREKNRVLNGVAYVPCVTPQMHFLYHFPRVCNTWYLGFHKNEYQTSEKNMQLLVQIDTSMCALTINY